MHIAGFGSMGLPLSQRDAVALKGIAEQAPYGHGTETLVNKDVRDTWELEGNRVSFLSAKWKAWLDSIVIPTVRTTLGVPLGARTLCNLYKLLLYEKGSQYVIYHASDMHTDIFSFLAHQE